MFEIKSSGFDSDLSSFFIVRLISMANPLKDETIKKADIIEESQPEGNFPARMKKKRKKERKVPK